MRLTIALVLGGSLVYLANDSAGALMIAAGCALEVVSWLWRRLPQIAGEASHEPTHQA